MSDSILVKVRLDHFDFAHPAEKQTRVDVQIPEVARASWLLPAELFHGLKLGPWPNVVDAAHEYFEQSGMVSDSSSAAARAAVWTWMRDAANRDEMQAAWELDQARRDPVARKLLAENERLRARVAELEQLLAAKDRPVDEDPIAFSLTAEASCGRALATGKPCPDHPKPQYAKDVTPQLRELVARQRAAVEDPHDSPLHHNYRVSRDMPEVGR